MKAQKKKQQALNVINILQIDKYGSPAARSWGENELYMKSNIFEYRHFIQWIL